MALLRFDPFRELHRFIEQSPHGRRSDAPQLPIPALPREDVHLLDLDMPGVHRDDVDLTVERNVVAIRARRMSQWEEADEVILDVRPYGEFACQLSLGDEPRRRQAVRRPTRRCAASDHPRQRGGQIPAEAVMVSPYG